MIGKCPSCKQLVTSLRIHVLQAIEDSGAKWKAATYTCPGCGTVLGASLDPTAQTAEIVEALLASKTEIMNRLSR